MPIMRTTNTTPPAIARAMLVLLAFWSMAISRTKTVSIALSGMTRA